MEKQWSVHEIVGSLKVQVAQLREKAAFHAEQEAFHREERSRHDAELAEAVRRLETFEAAAAEAMEFASRAPAASVAPSAQEDFGPASKPHLTRMVEKLLVELTPKQVFGPGWIAQELNRRFGERLRSRIKPRQVSDVLRRLARSGRIQQVRKGRARYEARFVRTA